MEMDDCAYPVLGVFGRGVPGRGKWFCTTEGAGEKLACEAAGPAPTGGRIWFMLGTR
jgi:hypothetical protein